MAGASDKARFYLEQSVPELQELRRKKLFTEQEISSIARKRSDFEHKVNARGSQPSDFARYAEYEMNLESLRRKRMKRQGLKKMGHLGDLGLWMQVLQFASKHKAIKKISQILTDILRLHPTRPEVWIYAANHALNITDNITEARSYMQRGLRFCKRSTALWLEYAKLEMLYISKIAARSRVLRLEGQRDENVNHSHDLVMLSRVNTSNLDTDTYTDDGVNRAVAELQRTPALSGAIPIAVFDAAMREVGGSCGFARQFFDQVAAFEDVPCTPNVLRHILERLQAEDQASLDTMDCFIRQPIVGVPVTATQFPSAIGDLFARYRSCTSLGSTLQGTQISTPSRRKLAYRTIEHILTYFDREVSDMDTSTILSAMLRTVLADYANAIQGDGTVNSEEVNCLLSKIEAKGLSEVAASMTVIRG